jgi:hypothetical protein
MGSARSMDINRALLGISRRAESVDRHALARSFVTAGSLSAMLHSADHQILYGRRGTGKTHALLYLSDLIEGSGDVAVYLDLRSLGSAGGVYADGSLSSARRGTYLVVDTLEALHEALLALAVEREVADQDGLLRALDALAEAATAVEVVGEVERETTIEDSAGSDRSAGMTASLGGRGPEAQASFSTSARRSLSAASRLRRAGVEQHRVLFGPLNRALRAVTDALGPSRFWLLLDEWSSVPLDLQPLLADLLRRSVLPTRGITVKIAAVERRSQFTRGSASGDYVGIEVGADAASAVSLDDFLIFEHSPTRAQTFFQQLFYNHVHARLPDALRDTLSGPGEFIHAAFRKNAFAELVRAAEGVPRDAINVAAIAAQHANTEQIGIVDVRKAARDWYLRDKHHAIVTNTPAREMLRRLIDEVIGRRRARTFLLDQATDAQHETIHELIDARLLHVLARGITDRKKPGTQYDAFGIDYGCYAALLLEGRVEFHKGRDPWTNHRRRSPHDDVHLHRSMIDLSALKHRDP